MNAIEIKNLSKSYRDFTLSDVSFSLPTGTIMGLVGENGAGKSTTIKLIMDAITRDSGEIKVLSCDNRSPQMSKIKQDIGVVLDEAYFPEVLTIKSIENIMKNIYTNWDSQLFNSFLSRFSLPTDKKFLDFSRGMKMKLAIAIALSHHPKLLILDEATSGLDPMVRDEILDVFFDFTREEDHSILLSSHIISDLEKVCDYITFMHRGRVVICEEKDVILERYAICKLQSDEFEALPEDAIIAKKTTAYGYDALVYKNMINESIKLEKTTLEDIVVFMAREGI